MNFDPFADLDDPVRVSQAGGERGREGGTGGREGGREGGRVLFVHVKIQEPLFHSHVYHMHVHVPYIVLILYKTARNCTCTYQTCY